MRAAIPATTRPISRFLHRGRGQTSADRAAARHSGFRAALLASRRSSRLPQSTGWGARSDLKGSDSRVPAPPLSAKRPHASLPRLLRPLPALPNPYVRTGTALLRAWLPASLLLQSNPNGTPGPETLPRGPKARAAPRTSSFFAAWAIALESPCGVSIGPAARCALSQTLRLRSPSAALEASAPISGSVRRGAGLLPRN